MMNRAEIEHCLESEGSLPWDHAWPRKDVDGLVQEVTPDRTQALRVESYRVVQPFGTFFSQNKRIVSVAGCLQLSCGHGFET